MRENIAISILMMPKTGKVAGLGPYSEMYLREYAIFKENRTVDEKASRAMTLMSTLLIEVWSPLCL